MSRSTDSKTVDRKTADRTIAAIARTVLGIETLEARHRDALDFHDLSVRKIEQALRAAYEAGRDADHEAGRKSATAIRGKTTSE